MTKAIRGLVVSALALAMAGCVNDVETPQSAADEPQAEESPKRAREAEHMRRKHHGPTAMLVGTALDSLDLTSEQQSALEELLDGMGPSEEGWAAHKELQAALAAGLRAGAIDEELVGEKLAVIQQHMAEANDKTVAALGTLHATLTPEQRSALVAIVHERGEKMREHMEAKRKAHAEAQAEGGDAPEGKRGRPRGGAGMWIARGLDMTDEQRAALAAALGAEGIDKPSREEMAARFSEGLDNWEAMLASFATAEFDANAHRHVVTFDHLEKGLEHYVASVKALAGILDQSQRDELAERIEQGPKWGKKGHGEQE
jgi:Spy/CpxP family protein refolding chaperone